MTKDEIIVMLAEQLAEVRHDRDLWKALYQNLAAKTPAFRHGDTAALKEY